MADLGEYRRRRDAARTPEPVPESSAVDSHGGQSFVIQEHHATALHWDFRLERDGVLVSWAVPKGLPTDTRKNRLAVQTEDHPLEYATFEGTIGAGQYGGGTVTIWDHGTYELEKWTEREVKFVLAGQRVQGRFVLFRTKGKQWMMHRMDAPSTPDWQPLPGSVAPMLATPGELPEDSDAWAFEMKWDGVRALARIEGGRISLTSRNDHDLTVSYPELRALGETVGSTQLLLDGEITSFDGAGRPSFARLQKRMHVSSAVQARELAAAEPVVYLVFDVLHHDGRSLIGEPYSARRALLDELGLNGPTWQTPPAFDGSGAAAFGVSQAQGLEGVVAKRRGATYQPGRRSADWIKVKNIRAQEVVIGGWRPGAGRREGSIGSLLVGLPTADGLAYAGKVGTGFTDEALDELGRQLKRLGRTTSPFSQSPGAGVPRGEAKDVHWVTPKIVGEVAFTEWTRDGRLRHPAWRGLRPDKRPDQVLREG
ncbi:non-homologous end-joining DNA ligase [Jatrophihabitans sp.]|uniref:non-homologous end-joining DNA ligase n=1 Tax=Jatrophihabitans sp. TaxID=1932789 RepID=UPI0030C695F4|nr:polymerase LigD, ligase domain protein [Jatrophihabitans sp.]